MSRRGAIAAAATALLTLASPAVAATGDKTEHVYGPEPDWAEYRRLAEAAIAAKLIDPESARFTWISGMHKGGIRAFLSRKIEGWAACGTVNARNRLGGYTGATGFMVAIDNGRVLGSAMDTRPGAMYARVCREVVANGFYPPAPAGTPSYAPASAEPSPIATATPLVPTISPLSGMAVRAMPEGAYVAAVVPGSPAATAGLKPGMVITTVNAVPLAGMGEAATKVVDAAGTTATLTLVDGRTIKLCGGK